MITVVMMMLSATASVI